MRRLIALWVLASLLASGLALVPSARADIGDVAVDILDIVDDAKWLGSNIVNGHYRAGNAEDGHVRYAFGGDHVRLEDDVVLENGARPARALVTIPREGAAGTIKGYLPAVRVPRDGVFRSRVALGRGAERSVRFQLFEHHFENGREVWHQLAEVNKDFDGRSATLEADVAHLAGRDVSFELRVDDLNRHVQARSNFECSKACPILPVWSETQIVQRAKPRPALPVLVRLETIRVGDANEDNFYSDGDEPYLMPVASFVGGDPWTGLPIANVQAPDRPGWGNLGREGVERGDEWRVPTRAGEFFGQVAPIPAFGALGDHFATVTIAADLWEEDGLLTEIGVTDVWLHGYEAMQRDLSGAALAEYFGAIIARQNPFGPDDAEVARRYSKAMRETTRDSMRHEQRRIQEDFFYEDDDDRIDTAAQSFTLAQIKAAGPDGVPFELRFEGNDARYHIEGHMFLNQ